MFKGRGLFFVSVVVVDADEWAAEGKDFAKCDKDGVVYLAQWWAAEARDEQDASEDA